MREGGDDDADVVGAAKGKSIVAEHGSSKGRFRATGMGDDGVGLFVADDVPKTVAAHDEVLVGRVEFDVGDLRLVGDGWLEVEVAKSTTEGKHTIDALGLCNKTAFVFNALALRGALGLVVLGERDGTRVGAEDGAGVAAVDTIQLVAKDADGNGGGAVGDAALDQLVLAHVERLSETLCEVVGMGLEVLLDDLVQTRRHKLGRVSASMSIKDAKVVVAGPAAEALVDPDGVLLVWSSALDFGPSDGQGVVGCAGSSQ